MKDRAFGHEMLRGKIVAEACFSMHEDPGYQSLCPGGVDKVAGAGTAVNCPVEGANRIHACDHGTHVASIAAGHVRGGSDGVARGANILAIQIFRKNTTTNQLDAFTTDVILGLKYVLKAHRSGKFKIAAVNLSLSDNGQHGKCNRLMGPIKAAIDNLLAEGDIPTIVAAGNGGHTGGIGWPACVQTAIAVGNTREDDQLYHSSNHSRQVALLAPGRNVLAAVPEGSLCIGPDAPPYCFMTGTSQAAPHVAGAFALLKGAFPVATTDQILKALQCSGKIVDHRQPLNGGPEKLFPPRKRIDVLGAYDHLKKPESSIRKWEFASGDEERDWKPAFGLWAVEDGAYKGRGNPAGAWVANCDENLSISARFRRPGAGEGDDSRAVIGIVFKTQIDHVSGRYSGYRFEYVRDAAEPGDKHSLFVRRWDDVDPVGGGGNNVRLCGPVARAWLEVNTFAVVSRGGAHKFVFNDQVVCKIEDATYKDGPVMVVSYTGPTGDAPTYVLDYVGVKTLAPDPPDSDMNPAAYASEPAQADERLTASNVR